MMASVMIETMIAVDALFAGKAEFLVARQTTEVGNDLFLHQRRVGLITGGTYTSFVSTRPSPHWFQLSAETTEFATEKLHLFLHQQRHGVHVLFERTCSDV